MNGLSKNTVLSKFVINRNHLEFIYTEKHSTMNGIYYLVREEKKFVIYNQDTFHSIYGNDKKSSLLKFMQRVDFDVLTSDIENKETAKLGLDVYTLEENLKKQNTINPSLEGYGYTFVSIIDKYNDIIAKRLLEEKDMSFEPIQDYEAQYQRVLENKEAA